MLMTLEDYSMYKIVLPSSFSHYVEFLPAQRYATRSAVLATATWPADWLSVTRQYCV